MQLLLSTRPIWSSLLCCSIGNSSFLCSSTTSLKFDDRKIWFRSKAQATRSDSIVRSVHIVCSAVRKRTRRSRRRSTGRRVHRRPTAWFLPIQSPNVDWRVTIRHRIELCRTPLIESKGLKRNKRKFEFVVEETRCPTVATSATEA